MSKDDIIEILWNVFFIFVAVMVILSAFGVFQP